MTPSYCQCSIDGDAAAAAAGAREGEEECRWDMNARDERKEEDTGKEEAAGEDDGIIEEMEEMEAEERACSCPETEAFKAEAAEAKAAKASPKVCGVSLIAGCEEPRAGEVVQAEGQTAAVKGNAAAEGEGVTEAERLSINLDGGA